MTRAAWTRMSVEPGVAAAAAAAQAHGLGSTTSYVRLRAGRDGGEFIFPAQVRLGSVRATPAPKRRMRQRGALPISISLNAALLSFPSARPRAVIGKCAAEDGRPP